MKLSFGKMLLVFTLIPFIELSLLFKIAEVTSGLTTLAIIILTGVVGAYFAKQQGMIVIQNIQRETQNGAIPGNELMHGLCVLIGGLLLLTPGILTDVFGFSLIIPLTRTLYIATGTEMFKKKVNNGSVQFYSNVGGQANADPHANTHGRHEEPQVNLNKDVFVHEEDDDYVKFD